MELVRLRFRALHNVVPRKDDGLPIQDDGVLCMMIGFLCKQPSNIEGLQTKSGGLKNGIK